MKKTLFLIFFLLPFLAHAQEVETKYPWVLTGFGGAASLCTEDGCFGPSGLSFGGSFGRPMSQRWSFELEGTYARTKENLPPRIDLLTGLLFVPQLERTRIWGGANFIAKLGEGGDASSGLFVSLGFVAGYEQQNEITPPEIFHAPTKDIGLKGGLSGGAGYNYWFNDHWGIRPEAMFYVVAGSLSGIRYTGGLMHKF
jgi:hypothetical protein